MAPTKTIWTQPKQVAPVQNHFGPIEGQGISYFKTKQEIFSKHLCVPQNISTLENTKHLLALIMAYHLLSLLSSTLHIFQYRINLVQFGTEIECV